MNKVILALGADIKNRFLLAKGQDLHFGPDIGDLSQADNYELFNREVNKAIRKFRPNIIAYDLHPNYFSSLFGREFSLQPAACSLQQVQHHHAHIASVIQEYKLKEPVIGVAFDGTGYGQDGNSWGGEFLLVDQRGFKRLAHLKYHKMPGGDKVVYEPWRMCLSILGEKALSFLSSVEKKNKELVLTMMTKDINSPKTSSAGRLFDAASALLGVCQYASYEAEGPIRLEAMCDERIEGRYRFKIIQEDGCFIIDTEGLFLGMLKDLKKGEDREVSATKFHNSMAEIIVAMVKKLSQSLGRKAVVLSGGVFQNKFLKLKVIKQLSEAGFNVFTNTKTPVNDLNISLGQYYISRYISVK